MSVPEIDLSGFLAGDTRATRSVCDRVNEALREVGFFTIVGHGVEPELLAKLSATAKSFFDLPPPEKKRFANPRKSISRGYVSLGEENLGRTLNGAMQTDLKEQLAFGRFDLPDDP